MKQMKKLLQKLKVMSKSTYEVGDEYEHYIAKDFGGKVVRGSGRVLFRPGDCKTNEWLIQCKFTGKDTYRLTLGDLIKSEKESYEAKKDFLFCVGIQKHKNTFVIERVTKVPNDELVLKVKKSFKLEISMLYLESFIYVEYANGYIYRIGERDWYFDNKKEE